MTHLRARLRATSRSKKSMRRDSVHYNVNIRVRKVHDDREGGCAAWSRLYSPTSQMSGVTRLNTQHQCPRAATEDDLTVPVFDADSAGAPAQGGIAFHGCEQHYRRD